jgi:hypothetical protein
MPVQNVPAHPGKNKADQDQAKIKGRKKVQSHSGYYFKILIISSVISFSTWPAISAVGFHW